MRCIAPSGLSTSRRALSPASGSGKMMENAGADDLIEARLQLADPLDGELADLEIVQLVFAA